MAIQESGEMYLETILILSQQKQFVHAIDIAEYMSFSKPSVSHAVGLLVREGLIEVDASNVITLTQEGRRLAERIFERHQVLSSFLTGLGVPESIAAADACKMEHDISDESFSAIKAFLAKA